MRAELRISAASRLIWLREWMVEHLADGIAADACLTNDLRNKDTLPEDLISDARPLRYVAVHSWSFFSPEHVTGRRRP
jgi:hypothetical protein